MKASLSADGDVRKSQRFVIAIAHACRQAAGSAARISKLFIFADFAYRLFRDIIALPDRTLPLFFRVRELT